MRIVHVISGLETGGAENMLARLLARMDRESFDMEVVSLTKPGALGPVIASRGVRVRALHLGGSRLFDGLAGLVRCLRERPVDLVQTWLYHADLIGGVAARLATKAPVVWNLRHSEFASPDGRRPWPVSACTRLSRWVPARIVSCSEVSRRLHVAMGYPADRMVVIPNGFDLGGFRPDADARAQVRREIGVPDDVPLVGLVARHQPEKDHRTFLRAASRVRRQFPRVRFLLCGSRVKWDNRELAGEIDAAGVHDSVVLLGRRSDMPRVNAALDVACSSSASEGFPNVIGEAMACGVPCVVTDVGDSGYIVADTGRIVPRRDPAALAAALNEILRLDLAERSRLGLAARRRIEEHFSLPSVVDRYEQLYRETLGARAASVSGMPSRIAPAD